jgi:hypothetical protein
LLTASQHFEIGTTAWATGMLEQLCDGVELVESMGWMQSLLKTPKPSSA